MTDSASEATGRIFISYRRQDSAYPAGWLYDRLAERFGPEQIFKDVDSIELGDDFVETITNAVGSCDILLALIGQEWLDAADSEGSRRLNDPDDFVRLEIEAALSRKVLLIPILVEGALMPRGDQLPPSIAPMVRRQALELSPNRFRADTERLLDVMERTLADIQDEQPGEPAVEEPVVAPIEPEPKPKPPGPPGVSRRVLLGVGGAIAALAVVVAIVLNAQADDPKKEAGATDDPTSAEATAPPQLGGPDAPVVLAHRGGDEEFAWQTIPAYEYAAGIGAQVEVDVRWTQDGTAVLVHDPGTTPGMECDGGDLKVENETWDLLRDTCGSPAGKSKDGKQYPIPTFDQAVSAVSKIPEAQIFAEVKVNQDARQVRQFLAILDSKGMLDRAVVTSFKPEELTKIQDEANKTGVDVRTMQFVNRPVPVGGLVDGLWGVAVEAEIATEPYVKALQAEGIEVMIFVVNTPAQWEEAVRLGADLVLTAKPTAFGEWFEDR